MCGICGKLHFDRQQPADARLLRRMMDRIAHRGPDGSGEFLSGPIGLGHRRLSIIDLATGGQPMSNEDGSVWVVYNGEIYNFGELRAALLERGHRFKSTTDTEVIVHLYEEMGDECVSHLRGMFSFALWDERRQRLLLARDRVGIKPLYYSRTGDGLVFASEIKSILADPSVDREINRQAIDRFLTYYYLPGNQTLFEHVHKLDPGHYLTVEGGRISLRQYWDLDFEKDSGLRSFDHAVQALEGLLSRTVKDHMISDVPVGVLLSGGVDSSGVLRYAAEHSDRAIHTFTVGFGAAGFADERPFARLAAQRYGTIHHEMSISADDFRDFLPRYVWHMEEPVCEPPAIALYFVSQLARQSSIKVLLSGEGGDEAFGGYQIYRNLLALEGLKSALGPAKGLLRWGLQTLGRFGWKQMLNYSKLINEPLSSYYLSRTASLAPPFGMLKPALYSDSLRAAVDPRRSTEPTHMLHKKVNGQALLNRMLYVDTKTWLPDDLLVKADKMTMATSVELRVPLLDYRILEFAASLPPSYKILGWKQKRILKAALAKSVPPEILHRKKTGFPVPYDHWLRNDIRDFVSDTLLAADSASLSYFSRETLMALLKSQQQGSGCAKEIFSLLVFELWHRQFLAARH